MLHYICTVIVLYFFVSLIWPSARKTQAASGSKHREVLEAIAKPKRQSAPPVQRALPTHKSAERARILALGRLRDGVRRHPILDSPYVSVANIPRLLALWRVLPLVVT
jgi:hypothetical protein